jgi:TolA-binding protein
MLAAAIMIACPVASAAQTPATVEGRVGKLEAEMRAVQRKVFPGGAGAQPVEPQFPESQPQTPTPGVPSATPITDLTARVTALETQMATMTGQIEQLQFGLRQQREAEAAYKAATDARLKAIEDKSVTASADEPAVVAPAPAPVPTRPMATRPAASAAATPAPTKAVAAPATAIAAGPAIEKPSSDDPAEDGYLYGYRLWQAKRYPEAIAALKDVTSKYPNHRRWSYAQNLLGRAYLDSGDAGKAGITFYDSYRIKPDGERAPDSLYYLAQALTQLKKPAADICRVYSELTDVYGAKLSAEMRAGVADGRAKQKCK